MFFVLLFCFWKDFPPLYVFRKELRILCDQTRKQQNKKSYNSIWLRFFLLHSNIKSIHLRITFFLLVCLFVVFGFICRSTFAVFLLLLLFNEGLFRQQQQRKNSWSRNTLLQVRWFFFWFCPGQSKTKWTKKKKIYSVGALTLFSVSHIIIIIVLFVLARIDFSFSLFVSSKTRKH